MTHEYRIYCGETEDGEKTWTVERDDLQYSVTETVSEYDGDISTIVRALIGVAFKEEKDGLGGGLV